MSVLIYSGMNTSPSSAARQHTVLQCSLCNVSISVTMSDLIYSGMNTSPSSAYKATFCATVFIM